MKKILLIIGILLLTFFILFSDAPFDQYEKRPFHYWVYTGSKDKQLHTSTFEEMVTLLKRETKQESGEGIMKYKYTNWDKTKGKIDFIQTYTGDDSIGPSKSYVLVEKQQKGWTITEYARTVNCSRGRSTSGSCL